MTITLKHTHTAKRGEESPCCKATAVVTAEQREEWDEGMPPESTNARRENVPVLNHLVKILRNWAENQPQKPTVKM
jgi:hypothetical protein